MELDSARLWDGERPIDLRPKTWDVLRFLAERPGVLVTKSELLEAVWPDAVVSEATLSQSIRELRVALGDDAREARYLVTVHRRGFRFLGRPAGPTVFDANAPAGLRVDAPAAAPVAAPNFFVGRAAELAMLDAELHSALEGRRRIVFVHGEAGIGKSTLVEAFVAHARSKTAGLLVATGQCVEQKREGEPYLPVLEALDRLCTAGGEEARALLVRYAPAWLVQMPWLIEASELQALQRALLGSGKDRMLRELMVATEALAAYRPLLLVLEDLHWSDQPTLDLLAALARRRESARMMVVATYRSVDPSPPRQSLRELVPSLVSRRDAAEVAVPAFSDEMVLDYIRERLDAQAPPRLADAIRRHAGGSPLFLATAAEYVLAQPWLVQSPQGWTISIDDDALEAILPRGLRQLIDAQLARVGPGERELLEIAAVTGIEFSAAVCAGVLAQDAVVTESRLAELSDSVGIFRAAPAADTETAASWSNASARFTFTHALFQQALYQGLAPAAKAKLHLRVGQSLEACCRGRTAEVAAELAVHFARAGQTERAIQYLTMAAANARARTAGREAIALLETALELATRLPPSRQQVECEIDLLTQLGAVLASVHGRGSPLCLPPMERAQKLGAEIDDVPRTFIACMISLGCYGLSDRLYDAERVCREARSIAARIPVAAITAVADAGLGAVLSGMGQLEQARVHLESAAAAFDPDEPVLAMYMQLEDPLILCYTSLAWTLAQQGYLDDALRRCEQATAIGQARTPYHYVYCRNASAILHMFLDNPAECLVHAEATAELSREHGFDGFTENAAVLSTWARERCSGASDGWLRLAPDVERYRRCTQRFGIASYLGLLGDAYLTGGRVEDGLAVVDGALAAIEQSGEHATASGLWRVRARLLATGGREDAEVESAFAESMRLAREKGARLLELRAATAFGEWLVGRGRGAAAAAAVAPVLGWFTQGRELPDVRRAERVLGRAV